MQDLLNRIWYQGHWAGVALIPLSWLFRLVAALRRGAYAVGVLRSERFPVPVVVVGNIALGGTGKTPLVIWLACHLTEQGLHPGVVSRGYGGRGGRDGHLVDADSDPEIVGDEPVLIARRCQVPVVVDPDRVRGARCLIQEHGCDVILCDDGLQHYRLRRDVEIAVVDAARRHGNGRCLPAGPLREPPSRLDRVDLVVVNGASGSEELPMRLLPGPVLSLAGTAHSRRLADFAGSAVHAVCGIGNPERFFAMLRGAGLQIHAHAFPDHHHYCPEDLELEPAGPILMTEKDAVKCRGFAVPDAWVVRVSAQLPESFSERLDQALGRAESPESGGDP